MFSSAFVRLFVYMQKKIRPIFTKFGRKMVRGSRKKPLLFIGITLRY